MTKRALLVGINAYPGCPLRGCVNDVLDMADLLVSQYGFAKHDITILTDRRATTQSILAALPGLVKGMKAGDQAVFHYSGHGAQVPDHANAWETDGLDEVICPVDFDWSDARMIKDKQFHEIFAPLDPKADFIWVSDSCHSGDLSREMPQWRIKNFPQPKDVEWHAEAVRAKPAYQTRRGLTRGAFAGSLWGGEVLISGCTSMQTSADASFAGRPSGALTHYLLKALKETTNIPLVDLVASVRTSLAHAGYTQTPQVEGNAELMKRPFLK